MHTAEPVLKHKQIEQYPQSSLTNYQKLKKHSVLLTKSQFAKIQ